MSIWVIRGGKFGEYENRFLNEDKVYLTRDGFKTLIRLRRKLDYEQFLMNFIQLNHHLNYQAGQIKFGNLPTTYSKKIG